MSDKKICPLRVLANFTGDGQHCIEDKCAWYVKIHGYCAIKTIAYFMEAKKS